MQLELRIFVDGGCPGCAEAHRLANVAQELLPRLDVELIDVTIEGTRIPKQVFAVPTYVLNGKTQWLGNPDEIEFIQHLRAALMLS
jgi:predicted acylesterase/phospholipase RssA